MTKQLQDAYIVAATRTPIGRSHRGFFRNANELVYVKGASVAVNGTKVQLSATKELPLPVGTHAVTVTHPQYHNFVKFVDVDYGKTTPVDVNMKQYPIIEHDIQGKPISRDRVSYTKPPWYLQPYLTGPVIAVAAVVTVAVTLAVSATAGILSGMIAGALAGAAGIACAEMFVRMGVKRDHVLLVDTVGVVAGLPVLALLHAGKVGLLDAEAVG